MKWGRPLLIGLLTEFFGKSTLESEKTGPIEKIKNVNCGHRKRKKSFLSRQ